MKPPTTLEEKIDHLLSRIAHLEGHVISNITMKQDLPSINNLVIQLNGYTAHVEKMHTAACSLYDKMEELCRKFRQECAPYGEVKFLNKKLHEIQQILENMKKQSVTSEVSKMPISWIEELNLELQKKVDTQKQTIDKEESAEDKEYRDYEKRVLPFLDGLESLEKQMLLFRCKPTHSGQMPTYKVISREFNTEYNEARVICRKAIRKLDYRELARLNEHNFSKMYYQVTGRWPKAK